MEWRDVTIKEQAWYKLFHAPGIGSKALWKLHARLNNQSLRGVFSKDKLFFEDLFNKDELHTIQKAYDSERLSHTHHTLKIEGVEMMHPQITQDTLAAQDATSTHVPAVLFYKGPFKQLLTKQNIAIVGSRNAEPYICQQTEHVAATCVRKNYGVVSGYAKGVDTHAHAGALNMQGMSAAILPYGIKCLPHHGEDILLHPTLQQRLHIPKWQPYLCFVSQFEPFKRWSHKSKGQGIQRNKTICALSDTIIVMASEVSHDKQSGSYQTAKIAIDMDVPLLVFVPPHKHRLSSGNKRLLTLPKAMPFSDTQELTSLLQDLNPASQLNTCPRKAHL